jgi:uroporphyrinogen-III synthase
LLEPGDRVLFAGAEGARDLIARELDADVLVLYRTEEETVGRFPEADLVLLASASAARALARLCVDLPCVSIGPVTTAEARRLGLWVVAEAARHDFEGLATAARLAASGRS